MRRAILPFPQNSRFEFLKEMEKLNLRRGKGHVAIFAVFPIRCNREHQTKLGQFEPINPLKYLPVRMNLPLMALKERQQIAFLVQQRHL